MNDLENPDDIASEFFTDLTNMFIERANKLEELGFANDHISIIITDAKIKLYALLEEEIPGNYANLILSPERAPPIITNDQWVTNLYRKDKK